MQSWWQYLIPQLFLSRILGQVALCRWVWLKNALIGLFVRHFKVDMSKANESDYTRYPNFHEFFTRVLKPGIRSIDVAANTITSPADGAISELGIIESGRLLQAKHHYYSVHALLGGDASLAEQFRQGHFVTIYLAPKDYHRVHMPFSGELQQMDYIPGRLFSVNNQSAKDVSNLFARNERVVSIFKTTFGPMAVVLVGAMVVGSMHTVWHGQVTPAKHAIVERWDYRDKSISLNKGDELGFFTLGSTVIVLLPSDVGHWSSALMAGSSVEMGQRIGEIQV